MSVKKLGRDLWKKDVFPRLRLERMTSSKSLMAGSSARVLSRSWMNSLKPVQALAKYKLEFSGSRTLGLLHHEHVLLIFVRHALHELVHLEVVKQTRLLLIPCSRAHVSPICVE